MLMAVETRHHLPAEISFTWPRISNAPSITFVKKEKKKRKKGNNEHNDSQLRRQAE